MTRTLKLRMQICQQIDNQIESSVAYVGALGHTAGKSSEKVHV